jgi:hypothetical protein
MAECSAMRESFPLLLTESLDPATRELTHQHIESCAECGDEWQAMKEAWRLMAELPDVEPPARVREAFLAEIGMAPKANVVPFVRRPAFKWLAQAAAVAVIAGAAFFAGDRDRTVKIAQSPARLDSIRPVSTLPIQPAYSISESRVLQAEKLSPNIEGRPDIQNVQFVDNDPNDDAVQLSFDVTQHVTVTGTRADKSMVRLITYVLENEDQMSPQRSRAIDWVRQAYAQNGSADPEIAQALAKVLRNDSHEGVRIKAADTLKTMPPDMAGATDTRDALIAALKNDPNPAVRIKAVDALANLARSGQLDALGIDTLRQKAMQDDENPYVRTRAAEALSNIRP